MPSASSFINKVRAASEGRNTKVEYRGGIAQTNTLGALGCSEVNWWVDTKYEEISKSCKNIIIVIKNVLATIDTITGLFSVSWDLKTLCDSTVLYNSYLNLYRSDGVLIETVEIDRFTTTATFSTVLISGYSYYATINSLEASAKTDTIQFIYGNPIYISVLPTDIIPYVVRRPYIIISSNTITTYFFSTFPTLVRIDYYYTNVNATSNGTLAATFTGDTSLITSHSYTATSGGYYYVVITPTNKTSVSSSNTVNIPSVPVATSLVYSGTTLTLNYTMDKNSPVNIYYYSSVTPTSSQTFVGTNNVNATLGTNTNTFTTIANSGLYYHATIYGIGNTLSIDSGNTILSFTKTTDIVATLQYYLTTSSSITINYYSRTINTGNYTLLSTKSVSASTGFNVDSITVTSANEYYATVTIGSQILTSSVATNARSVVVFSGLSTNNQRLQNIYGPAIMPNGNIYVEASEIYGCGGQPKHCIYTPTSTSPTLSITNNPLDFIPASSLTVDTPLLVGSDNSLYMISDKGSPQGCHIASISNSTAQCVWFKAIYISNSNRRIYSIVEGSSYLYAAFELGILQIDKTNGNYTRVITSPTNGIYIAIGLDSNIYVQASYSIYVYNQSAYALIWSRTTGFTSSKGKFAISSAGVVYSNNSTNNAVDAMTKPTSGTTGLLSWSFSLGKTSTNNIFIGYDGTIYASSGDTAYESNTLYAINPNGSQKWSYTHPVNCTIRPVGIYRTGDVDIIYALINTSTTSNALYGFSSVNGSILSTMIGDYKTAAIGTDRKIFAFTPQSSTTSYSLLQLSG